MLLELLLSDGHLIHGGLWVHVGSGLRQLALGARLGETRPRLLRKALHLGPHPLHGDRFAVEGRSVRVGPLQRLSLRLLELLYALPSLAMGLLDGLNDLERPDEALVFAHSLRELGDLVVLAVPQEETLKVYVLVVGELVVFEGPAYLSPLLL